MFLVRTLVCMRYHLTVCMRTLTCGPKGCRIEHRGDCELRIGRRRILEARMARFIRFHWSAAVHV
jgi:hypothetical protein